MKTKAICPYCEKNAKTSYTYPDMILCVNSSCFYYMKDDIRNIDDSSPRAGYLDIILSLKHTKKRKGFVYISISDKVLCDAMEALESVKKRKGTSQSHLLYKNIDIPEEDIVFFEYTSPTQEMDELLDQIKYRELKNLKIRNFKSNKKINTHPPKIIVSEKGIRVQTKEDKTYETLNSCLIPWDFF